MKKLIKYGTVLTIITFFISCVVTLCGHFGLDEYMQGAIGTAMGIATIEILNEYFKDKQ